MGLNLNISIGRTVSREELAPLLTLAHAGWVEDDQGELFGVTGLVHREEDAGGCEALTGLRSDTWIFIDKASLEWTEPRTARLTRLICETYPDADVAVLADDIILATRPAGGVVHVEEGETWLERELSPPV